VWLLYVLVMVQAALQSINQPARQAFIAQLVPKEQLTAAVALNMLTARLIMLFGPGLAGIIAGVWGLRTCYAIDAASFTAALYGIGRLPPMLPGASAGLRPRRLQLAADGLQYIRRSKILVAAFLTDLNAMIFGSATALFPALNAAHFGGSPETLGLLITAPGVGGLLSATVSGATSRLPRQGRTMLVGCMFWGLAMAGFALATTLWLALLLLAAAGAMDTLIMTYRTAIVQAVTPNELRGRVSSVDYIVGNGGGGLGRVESGTLATFTSPVISAVAGGLACALVAVLIGARFRSFDRYTPSAAPSATSVSVKT
jgi:MFS family permease